MIISIFNQGKGQAGPIIKYLFSEEDHKGFKPELVDGDPELTKQIVSSITRKHKYITGVISFKDGENLTVAQQYKLIEEFQNTFAPFDDPSRMNWLWVRHMDKNGRLELHWVCPNQDMKTGLRFNISPPGKANQDFYKKFCAKKNYEFGFQQVGRKNKDGITEITPLRHHEYKQICREVNQYIDKRIEYIILNIDNKKLGRQYARKRISSKYKNGTVNNGKQTELKRGIDKAVNAKLNRATRSNINITQGSELLAQSYNSFAEFRHRINDSTRKRKNSNNAKSVPKLEKSNQGTSNTDTKPQAKIEINGYSFMSLDDKILSLVKSMETCPLEQLGQIYEELGRLQKQKLELGFTMPNPNNKIKF